MGIKNNSNENKKASSRLCAQQLVEFLLVAPFLVILLGLVTEYAYALNINMTLQQGLKDSTAYIYSEIKPGMSQSDIRDIVKNDLIKYLAANNAPTKAANNITVGYVVSGDVAVFFAGYTYIPAFTLPNVYFRLMPDRFNFLSTAAVPSSFLGANAYPSSIDSTTLDQVWSSVASFSSADSYNDARKGVMNTAIGSIPTTQTNMMFLVPDAVVATTYNLVHWDGSVDNCVWDSTGTNLSGTGCTGGSIYNYLVNNGYYNVMFVHDDALPGGVSDVPANWQTGSGKLSDKTAGGVLKRVLAFSNMSNSSQGSYDASGNYTVESFGSMMIVYSAADDISNIKTGSAPDYSYDFTGD